MKDVRVQLSEEEIFDRLGERTDQELIDFRQKLVRIGTPESWNLRFLIVRELLWRSFVNSVRRSIDA